MQATPLNTGQSQARTRTKICGITRVEDAVAAAEAGADALGLVFFTGSPRHVDIAQARAIRASVPPFVTVVGLFVNPAVAEVNAVLAEVALDLLQFHGNEIPEFCCGFRVPYIKAIRVRSAAAALSEAHAHRETAQGLLLDAWDEQRFGGTGQSFDWREVAQLAGTARIILAGGLRPGNVAEAIRIAQPWAVDVSSGVEEAPGLKSSSLIRQFISEVQRV